MEEDDKLFDIRGVRLFSLTRSCRFELAVKRFPLQINGGKWGFLDRLLGWFQDISGLCPLVGLGGDGHMRAVRCVKATES